jgi:hypothetical protein
MLGCKMPWWFSCLHSTLPFLLLFSLVKDAPPLALHVATCVCRHLT